MDDTDQQYDRLLAIMAEAHNAAKADSDAYAGLLDLTDVEKAFVLHYADRVFDKVCGAFDAWSNELPIRDVTVAAALAVATQRADRLRHHSGQLFEQEKGSK